MYFFHHAGRRYLTTDSDPLDGFARCISRPEPYEETAVVGEDMVVVGVQGSTVSSTVLTSAVVDAPLTLVVTLIADLSGVCFC